MTQLELARRKIFGGHPKLLPRKRMVDGFRILSPPKSEMTPMVSGQSLFIFRDEFMGQVVL